MLMQPSALSIIKSICACLFCHEYILAATPVIPKAALILPMCLKQIFSKA